MRSIAARLIGAERAQCCRLACHANEYVVRGSRTGKNESREALTAYLSVLGSKAPDSGVSDDSDLFCAMPGILSKLTCLANTNRDA
jgi:hypothetical protein